MSDVILRVYEGEPLPTFALWPRILQTIDVPYGSGTASRRQYVVVVTDGRYWLTEDERRAKPLGTAGADEAAPSYADCGRTGCSHALDSNGVPICGIGAAG